jgi:hypothetical protein
MIEETLPPYNQIQTRFEYACTMIQRHSQWINANSPEWEAYKQYDKEYIFRMLDNTVTEDFLERGISHIRDVLRNVYSAQEKVQADTHTGLEGYNYAIGMDK